MIIIPSRKLGNFCLAGLVFGCANIEVAVLGMYVMVDCLQ